MWLTGRLVPDHKTIADFRKDNGKAIRNQGRAADALGKTNDARAHYETAARYSTAYYGQLARARLGLKDIVMRSPPDRAPARADVVRAIEILYDVGERDLIAGGL